MPLQVDDGHKSTEAGEASAAWSQAVHVMNSLSTQTFGKADAEQDAKASSSTMIIRI